MNQGNKRHRFAFTLRTMFLIVTVSCLAISWVTYQLSWIRERHFAMTSLQGRLVFANGTSYGHDGRAGFVTFWTHVKLKPAPWSLRIFGELGAGHLVFDMPENDPQLTRFRELFPEASVSGRKQTSTVAEKPRLIRE